MEPADRRAASVYADTGATVTLGAGSTLVPVVDNNLNGSRASGLLATAPGGTVTIEAGARVRPWFETHSRLAKGAIKVDAVFIDTGKLNGGAGGPPGTPGTINGSFANVRGGLTIQYTIRKSADNSQYLISYERIMEIPEALPIIPCENARRLMTAFEELYSTGSGDGLVRRVMAGVDHSQDAGDLIRQAAHVGLTLTPQAYTKLTGTQPRTIELMQNSVFRRMDNAVERNRPATAPGCMPAATIRCARAPDWPCGIRRRNG